MTPLRDEPEIWEENSAISHADAAAFDPELNELTCLDPQCSLPSEINMSSMDIENQAAENCQETKHKDPQEH